MTHYPVFLRLGAKKVVLIGGGAVALQKIPALLEAGAQLTVISPEALVEIERFAAEGKLRWEKRRYNANDLEGAALAIAATDDDALQRQAAADCRARNIWVNVVDVPPLCDFIAPAIVRRGDVQVAISTGGAAPALAKYLRKTLERTLGDEYAIVARLAKRVRPDVLKWPKPRRAGFWECVASDYFIELVRRDGAERAEAKMKEWVYGNRPV